MQHFALTGRPRMRGAILLIALLTIFFTASLATALLRNYSSGLEWLSGQRDQAQARQMAAAALDYARNVLSEDLRTSNIDYPGEIWSVRVPPTSTDVGEVAGVIEDWSGRFNLNSLVISGATQNEQVRAWSRLLLSLQIAPDRALSLTQSLLYWLGASDLLTSVSLAEREWYQSQTPAWQPSGRGLIHLDELNLVRGFDPAVLDKLRPYVVAVPDANAPVNVNNASAYVLSAFIQGLDNATAQQLVARQKTAPFRTLAEFAAQLPSGLSLPSGKLAVSSRYFLVSGWARSGLSTLQMRALVDRNQRWGSIVWKQIL